MDAIVGSWFLKKKVFKKEKEVNDQFEDCTREEYEQHDIKIIGLYFAAHWCPSSRNFTKILIDFYNEIKTSKEN